MERPEALDRVILENEVAYASYTHSGGKWTGALFARKDIPKGALISEYAGRVLTKSEAEASESEYVMRATDVRDRRRRVDIDGAPDKYPNLAGYANFAPHRHANALFVDAAKYAAPDRVTYVLLLAKTDIPEGVEIRVDYDRGVAGTPFFDQMLARGVDRQALVSHAYLARRWPYPRRPTCRTAAPSPKV